MPISIHQKGELRIIIELPAWFSRSYSGAKLAESPKLKVGLLNSILVKVFLIK